MGDHRAADDWKKNALAYYHDHKQEIDELREQNSYERWQQEQATRAAA